MSSMAKYLSFYTRQHLTSERQSGFTLIELMVGIAIVSVLVTVGIPSLNQFLLQMRVDNEIAATQRIMLVARNTAINTEMNTVVCPLRDGTNCGGDWTGQVSVFADANGDNQFNVADDDRLITVKDAIKDNDNLTSPGNRFVYGPTGQLVSADVGLIAYCPYGEPDYNRGIVVSASGRVAASIDSNNDGKDETRAGTSITCS